MNSETNTKNEVMIAMIKYAFETKIRLDYMPEIWNITRDGEFWVHVMLSDMIEIDKLQELHASTIDGYLIEPSFIDAIVKDDNEHLRLNFTVKKAEVEKA